MNKSLSRDTAKRVKPNQTRGIDLSNESRTKAVRSTMLPKRVLFSYCNYV